MNVKNILIEEHLKDLRRSGLSDETILTAGLETIPVKLLKEELGYRPKNLKSAYRIPYLGKDFCRYRLFYHEWAKKGLPKYLQKKGSGNRLYIPKSAREHLDNPDIPIYITEGEKKALKACQEGMCCIALSGLWSWSDGNKRLIKDFDKLTLKGRKVYIVPDSDWQQPDRQGYQKKNLKKAVYELSRRLIEKGAKVYIVDLNTKEE